MRKVLNIEDFKRRRVEAGIQPRLGILERLTRWWRGPRGEPIGTLDIYDADLPKPYVRINKMKNE